jgi:tripartite-type tricarboxylate transporter receptor subunit TctC
LRCSSDPKNSRPSGFKGARPKALNKEINAALTDPVMAARFANLGATVFPASTADFTRFLADETEKWAKVIKFAGIKAE